MATDEAQAFYSAVYSVVRLIPKGQVTTYGILRFLLRR
jgi:alkylated DNA nucleotide flippase Atl1